MANGGKPNPGSWGAKNPLSTEKELREYLAVLESWKNSSLDKLVVREYTVIKPLSVRDRVTGPMLEVSGANIGQVYRGNTQQYEFIENFGDGAWDKILSIKDKTGILLN